MTKTTLQALTTQTGTLDGDAIDVSAIHSDWTIVIEIQALSGPYGAVARFTVEDSVDAFANSLAGPCLSVTANDLRGGRFTFMKKDCPSLRIGTASAQLRLSLTELVGAPGATSVRYRSWIES